jgi:hypothetical protein
MEGTAQKKRRELVIPIRQGRAILRFSASLVAEHQQHREAQRYVARGVAANLETYVSGLPFLALSRPVIRDLLENVAHCLNDEFRFSAHQSVPALGTHNMSGTGNALHKPTVAIQPHLALIIVFGVMPHSRKHYDGNRWKRPCSASLFQ